MKITILTSYFEPEELSGIHLLSDLCRDGVKYGADVTVVTGFPSRGIDEELRIKYLDRNDEYIDQNIHVLRVGTKSPESRSFLRRGFRYFFQTISLYTRAKKTETDIYFIDSTPPFLGVAGALLSKKAPTIYNLQDVFPDSLIIANKTNERSIFIKLFRKMEQFIYNGNTHIIAISEDFQRTLLSRKVSESKISVVYNWIDEKDVIPIERKENLLFLRYNLDPNKFYITYCGNIGYSQNLEMIIDIISEIEHDLKDIEFVIIGDGAWKSTIENYINDKAVESVRMLPFQPYEDISHVMSLGNVSLVCSKKNVGNSSFPSKTWSIMSAARPVLASFDLNSELCAILNKANAGLCSNAEDKEQLKANILELYYDRQKTDHLGQNGRQFIEENLTRQLATKKYFDILSEVAQKEK